MEWTTFQSGWMGSTDYIDRVSANSMGSSFLCCFDMHKRLVLLMKREADVAVLFQRYTDCSATWVFASLTLPIGGRRLSEEMADFLNGWLTS